MFILGRVQEPGIVQKLRNWPVGYIWTVIKITKNLYYWAFLGVSMIPIPFLLSCVNSYNEGAEFQGCEHSSVRNTMRCSEQAGANISKGHLAEQSCCHCSSAPAFANLLSIHSVPCPIEMYLGTAKRLYLLTSSFMIPLPTTWELLLWS